MIYILSAGRSGSAWLCTCLTSLGLDCVHEWYPASTIDPDVVADTSLVWNVDGFLATVRADDVFIILDRRREDIEASVKKLLGVEQSWDLLFDNWERMKREVKKFKYVYTISYNQLMTYVAVTTVRNALKDAGFITLGLEDVARTWDFMRNMRVTNKTAEQACKESYDAK